MSDFHKEMEHTGFALLYSSANIEEKYKETIREMPCFILCEKDEKRWAAMVTSADDLLKEFRANARSALGSIAIAKTYEEMLLIEVGAIRPKSQGFCICLACLSKAILACEEQLTVLKDIQEATKEYAAKL